jgi:hypothetical protein
MTGTLADSSYGSIVLDNSNKIESVDTGASKGKSTLIRHNGTNLWIGADSSSNGNPHSGMTYISSGLSNSTIKISVPSSDGTSATTYDALHSGYVDTSPTTGSSGWYNCRINNGKI